MVTTIEMDMLEAANMAAEEGYLHISWERFHEIMGGKNGKGN